MPSLCLASQDVWTSIMEWVPPEQLQVVRLACVAWSRSVFSAGLLGLALLGDGEVERFRASRPRVQHPFLSELALSWRCACAVALERAFDNPGAATTYLGAPCRAKGVKRLRVDCGDAPGLPRTRRRTRAEEAISANRSITEVHVARARTLPPVLRLRGMRELTLRGTFDAPLAGVLPSGLQKLVLESPAWNQPLLGLPDGLRTLVLRTPALALPVTPEGHTLSGLPRRLQHLVLYLADEEGDCPTPAMTPHSGPTTLVGLPEGLRTLFIGDNGDLPGPGGWAGWDLQRLPASLEVLTVSCELQAGQGLAHLPRLWRLAMDRSLEGITALPRSLRHLALLAFVGVGPEAPHWEESGPLDMSTYLCVEGLSLPELVRRRPLPARPPRSPLTPVWCQELLTLSPQLAPDPSRGAHLGWRGIRRQEGVTRACGVTQDRILPLTAWHPQPDESTLQLRSFDRTHLPDPGGRSHLVMHSDCLEHDRMLAALYHEAALYAC